MSIKEPVISILAQDPIHRQHRINANSFQQDVITTFNGFQYAVFYIDASTSSSNPSPSTATSKASPLTVTIARRSLKPAPASWEYISFLDHVQTTDDGHNTISLGICPGDGTIHLAWDHHCDPLKFRISEPSVATDPGAFKWTPEIFETVSSTLPGLQSSSISMLQEVTYPRFCSTEISLFFTHRIGQAGLGSDVLYIYTPDEGYRYLGQHLTGIQNSPYINGISYSPTHSGGGGVGEQGRLHLSWCYRGFVEFERKTGEEHKAQAGPNGPENNEGLHYMYSEVSESSSAPLGTVWKDRDGSIVCDLTSDLAQDISTSSTSKTGQRMIPSTVLPTTPGITAYAIPRNSGILNQESQCVGPFGTFHVLNRELLTSTSNKKSKTTPTWSKRPIPAPSPPTSIGNRGVVTCFRDWVIVVLPGNKDDTLSVMGLLWTEVMAEDGEWKVLWRGNGYDGEPGVDEKRLSEEGVLSVFTRTSEMTGAGTGEGRRDVVVLDFELGSLLP